MKKKILFRKRPRTRTVVNYQESDDEDESLASDSPLTNNPIDDVGARKKRFILS